MVAVAAVAAAQSLGCATPEQRHRVLSFFFDGVPPLYPEEPEPTYEERAAGELQQVAEGRPKTRIISIHGPVAKRECDQCHESRFSNKLKAEKQDLCWSCHNREDFPGEVVHGPVAAGFCDACHDPHRSPHRFLLVRDRNEICQNCHDQFTFANLAEHRAAEGGVCQDCHDPHAGGRKYMLKRDAEPS
jgi:predicted CXXCH cytochrome family protein